MWNHLQKDRIQQSVSKSKRIVYAKYNFVYLTLGENHYFPGTHCPPCTRGGSVPSLEPSLTPAPHLKQAVKGYAE